ncbi:hypothetical protein [Aquisediminimonas profunda]|uniref:bestrophin-like domain n=1 Tax=Aquisediminimonas profunda TaxID=1550733 RepID=UPI001C637367|nr:hypothetical protein [Aquisediminimonas profunda]
MGLIDGFMARGQLWLVGLALFLTMLLAVEAGAALRKRLPGSNGKGEASEGYLLSATLALLGLLIAFTFSLAVSRFDARRQLVVDEANAIGTAWLRAGLAEGPQDRDLRQAIAHYTDVRLGLSRGRSPEIVERETAVAQKTVWDSLGKTIDTAPPAIVNSTVIAVNDMFDAAASRKAERGAIIPARVLEILVLYAVLSASIVGYVLSASGQRHIVVTSILFLLLTLAITLILDLDRPQQGSIMVPQQPMLDARMSMQ